MKRKLLELNLFKDSQNPHHSIDNLIAYLDVDQNGIITFQNFREAIKSIKNSVNKVKPKPLSPELAQLWTPTVERPNHAIGGAPGSKFSADGIRRR